MLVTLRSWRVKTSELSENHPNHTELNFLRPLNCPGTHLYAVTTAGKFVAIHGTVIRVSNVKPLVKKMAFSCNLCSQTQVWCLCLNYAVMLFCIYIWYVNLTISGLNADLCGQFKISRQLEMKWECATKFLQDSKWEDNLFSLKNFQD